MSQQTPELYPGSIVEKDGVTYCIRRISTRQKNLLVVDIDGDPAKELHFTLDQFAGAIFPKNLDPTYDLEEIDSEDWAQALKRFQLVRPLLQLSVRTKSDVSAVAHAAQVDISTVYRWLTKFATTSRVSAFLRAKRRDHGAVRLSREVEVLIAQIVNQKILTKQKLNPTKVYRDLTIRCKDAGYELPHINTFLARVRRIAPVTYAGKRRGKNAALALQPIKGSIPWATSPYSLIQIDHTVVDIILVDRVHRLPLKRPWLTLAIDVNTRMIAGYYIAFDPPGTLGTGICLSNMILAKEPILAKFGIDTNWPCQGIPGIIHADNAKEFRGKVLQMVCDEYGIELKFRKIKTPQYGAHIERLMGTFMSEVHALPGSTFSNSQERKEYNSANEAAMTLEDFEKWLLNLIRAYHHRPHGELGMPPIQKYLQSLAGDGDSPGVGILPTVQDADKLRIDFLPLERRSVQPYGLLVDNIYYFSDVLHRWIGSKDPDSIKKKRLFLIRRDPRDISYILFYDPDLYRYFRVPYRNTSFPAISLWELRAVNKYLAERGKLDIDEEQIFEAYREMQTIEDKAVKLTKQKKSSRLAKERKHTVETHPTPMSVAATIVKDEPERRSPLPKIILPFDEVEDC